MGCFYRTLLRTAERPIDDGFESSMLRLREVHCLGPSLANHSYCFRLWSEAERRKLHRRCIASILKARAERQSSLENGNYDIIREEIILSSHVRPTNRWDVITYYRKRGSDSKAERHPANPTGDRMTRATTTDLCEEVYEIRW